MNSQANTYDKWINGSLDSFLEYKEAIQEYQEKSSKPNQLNMLEESIYSLRISSKGESIFYQLGLSLLEGEYVFDYYGIKSLLKDYKNQVQNVSTESAIVGVGAMNPLLKSLFLDSDELRQLLLQSIDSYLFFVEVIENKYLTTKDSIHLSLLPKSFHDGSKLKIKQMKHAYNFYQINFYLSYIDHNFTLNHFDFNFSTLFEKLDDIEEMTLPTYKNLLKLKWYYLSNKLRVSTEKHEIYKNFKLSILGRENIQGPLGEDDYFKEIKNTQIHERFSIININNNKKEFSEMINSINDNTISYFYFKTVYLKKHSSNHKEIEDLLNRYEQLEAHLPENKSCEYDEYSVIITKNFIFNNLVSKYASNNDVEITIEKLLEFDNRRHNYAKNINFYPDWILSKALIRILESMKDYNLYKEHINRLEEMISRMNINFQKHKRSNYLRINLPYKESLISTDFEIKNDKINIFVASTYLTAENYDNDELKIKSVEEDFRNFKIQFEILKENENKINSIVTNFNNTINENESKFEESVRKTEEKSIKRSIELLTIFSAVIAFLVGSTNFFKSASVDILSSFIMIFIYGGVCIMFATLIILVFQSFSDTKQPYGLPKKIKYQLSGKLNFLIFVANLIILIVMFLFQFSSILKSIH